jgi:hypothetical protein
MSADVAEGFVLPKLDRRWGKLMGPVKDEKKIHTLL